jgi:hypothetical protein
MDSLHNIFSISIMRKALFTLLLTTVLLSCTVLALPQQGDVVRVETGYATGKAGQTISVPVQVYNLPHEIGAITLIADFDPVPASFSTSQLDSERWPGFLDRYENGIYRTGWYYMPNRGYPNQVFISGEGLLSLDVVVYQNTKINLYVEFADRAGNVIPCQVKSGRIDVGVPYVPIPAWKCGDPITIQNRSYSTTYLQSQQTCIMAEDVSYPDLAMVLNGKATNLYRAKDAEKLCPDGWDIAAPHHLKALSLSPQTPGHMKFRPGGWIEQSPTIYWTSSTYRGNRIYIDLTRPGKYLYDSSTSPFAGRVRCYKKN